MSQHDIYMPGKITDELVRRLCKMFKDIACRRKLKDAGIRSQYVEKYGVDVQFGTGAKRGLVRIRFITEDDLDIEYKDLSLRELAQDRELWDGLRADTIEAIKLYRRKYRTPLEVRETPPSQLKNPEPMAAAVANYLTAPGRTLH